MQKRQINSDVCGKNLSAQIGIWTYGSQDNAPILSYKYDYWTH